MHVVDTRGDWAEVDINEDGRGEGFVAAEYLRPLNQMPAYVSGCELMSV